MKNKKNVIILIVLISIWGVSLLLPKKHAKDDSGIEKYEYSKKESGKTEVEKKDLDSWIKKKSALVLANKRNVFGKQEITAAVNPAGNDAKKREKEKNEITKNEKNTNKKNKQPETQVQYISVPAVTETFIPEPVKIDEVQLITTEMYNIEIHGVFLNNKNRTVFLMYKGVSYEIINEGTLKIFTNSKSYEVKAYFYEEDYITFIERSKGVTIKKRVKE